MVDLLKIQHRIKGRTIADVQVTDPQESFILLFDDGTSLGIAVVGREEAMLSVELYFSKENKTPEAHEKFFIAWAHSWHGTNTHSCTEECPVRIQLNRYNRRPTLLSFDLVVQAVKETDDGWKESWETYLSEQTTDTKQ